MIIITTTATTTTDLGNYEILQKLYINVNVQRYMTSSFY